MAYLNNPISNSHYHLSENHFVGRSIHSTTRLSNKEISKNHAVIEWQQTQWMLRDISKNGTWINGSKLMNNKRYPLCVGDRIHFDGNKKIIFQVENLDPPENKLIPCNNSNKDSIPIILDNYSLLPSDEKPEIAIYFEPNNQCWYQLSLLELEQEAPKQIFDNDILRIDNKDWQLKLFNNEALTQDTRFLSIVQKQIKYIFKLSQDEETTEIEIATPNEKINLNSLTHHYLTLTLARYRAADAAKGLDKASQGWIYVDQLAKDLGINNIHLNIQIHRARKQFSNAFDCLIDTNLIIQRLPGKIRFGGENMELYKGDQLECILKPSQRVPTYSA